MFKPKLFTLLKDYNRATFAADAIAGLTAGIVALPLAMAFAIASGLPPERGLFTAIVATGLHVLQDLNKKCRKEHTQLIFSGVLEQPLAVFRQSGFLSEVGTENFCPSIDDALTRSRKILESIKEQP